MKTTIERLSSQGDGTAQIDGKKVFFPFTAPLDEITGEVPPFKGTEGNGRTLSIDTPSPHRIEPSCKHFGSCGGCRLQHIHKELYTSFKEEQIRRPFRQQGIFHDLEPTLSIPASHRRRINFEAVRKNGQIIMGFHKRQSYERVQVESCPLIEPELNALWAPLRELMEIFLLKEREFAAIFLLHANNGIDIVIRAKHEITTNNELKRIEDFCEKNKICQLTHHKKKKRTTLFKKEEPYVLFGTHKVSANADCFLQTSHLSDEILENTLKKHINLKKNLNIIDLFCGRGTLSLPLLNQETNGIRIFGYESDKEAIEVLSCLQLNNLTVSLRNLFSDPLPPAELNQFDVALINPPRAGARSQAKALSLSKVPKIIYVSCGPNTLARDAKYLVEGGYSIKSLYPFDQFLWSHHVEAIAVFEKERA